MSSIPTKRIFVFIVLGALVFAVGTVAVVLMGDDDTPEADGLVLTEAEPQMETSASETSVTTTSLARVFVQVAGAVRRPGVYQMPVGARVFQAVEEAGGFVEGADRESVPLAAPVTDGCRVYVPLEGEQVSAAPGISAPQSVGSSTGGGPVSINSASVEELDSLPGIGPATAQKIIDYRDAKGPFTSVDQLCDVPGIGTAKLEQIRPLVGL